MLKKILLSVVLFCAVSAVSLAQTMPTTYKGTVGNVKITMTISSDWSNYLTTYSGTYYYDNIRKDLSLRGIWLARLETIELIEVGDGEVVSGYFSLKADPQRSFNVLTGTWTSLDKKRVLPVRLTQVN